MRRGSVRIGSLFATIALLVLASALPAAAWPPDAYADSTAETTRTVRADTGESLRVFSVTFTSVAGERRLVSGEVNAHQPSTTTDELLMAVVSVACTNGTAGGYGGVENTLRGGTTPFRLRFVHVAASSGSTTCNLTVKAGRPRPVGTDPASNIWYVEAGSVLRVSVPAASWSESEKSTATSMLRSPGQYWTPVIGMQPVPKGTTVEVISQQKVTSCTAVGGSSDGTTGGVDLCAGHVDTTGSQVRLDVFARQRNADDSGYCMAAVKIGTQSRFIDRNVHHGQFHATGQFTTSTSSACGTVVHYYGTVTIESGSDAVVHAPSAQATIVNP